MDYGRLHWYEPKELDEAQQALVASITSGLRDTVGRDEQGRFYGVFNAMIAEPRAGAAVERLGAALRFDIDLAPRAREIAILLTAVSRKSEYEWYGHSRIGAQAGLSELELAVLCRGDEPEGLSVQESAVFHVTSALLEGDLPDDVLATAEPLLGTATICDLVAIVGYYSLLALSLRVWRVPLREGATPVFS